MDAALIPEVSVCVLDGFEVKGGSLVVWSFSLISVLCIQAASWRTGRNEIQQRQSVTLQLFIIHD